MPGTRPVRPVRTEQSATVRYPTPPSPDIRLANDGTGHNQGPIQACLSPLPGTSIVPGSARMNVSLKVGALDATSQAAITEQSADRACYQAKLRPLSAEGGGDFRFFVTYDVLSTSYQLLNGGNQTSRSAEAADTLKRAAKTSPSRRSQQ